MTSTPVLLVHGIWDTAKNFDAMRAGLHRAGVIHTRAITLVPNNGSIPVAQMAQQVAHAAEALAKEHDAPRIDLVGFSMGALVTRYYVQRLGGQTRVRRYVSISGPHSGTFNAYFSWFAAGREMQPDSELLRDLARDDRPWGDVDAHSWITPWDVMIVPAASGFLRGTRTRMFPVPMHRFMITDARVITALAETLNP